VPRDFTQLTWNEQLIDDCRQLVRLAVREDLDRGWDWTTVSLVPGAGRGGAVLVARQPGVICGLRAAELALREMHADVTWRACVEDGTSVEPGTALARLQGSARDLLTCERIALNFVGRLSGISTLTRHYVDAIRGTAASVYDTRKTAPGWRRLEKYAVHGGGGRNHRTGLFDAILIKDNHLAFGVDSTSGTEFGPADAVRRVREFLTQAAADQPGLADLIVEIEVDSLEQLAAVLPAGPDIVLLDNMTPEQLRAAVTMRWNEAPEVQLEASGGVNLATIRAIAETGVERISVGALTHSAVALDVGLDWEFPARDCATARTP